MKKLSILFIAALLLPTLFACGQSNTITREQALQIALEDAGFVLSDVMDPDAELDRDSGKLHYDVDFEKNGSEYEYEIDAQTGEILRTNLDRD